MENILLDILWIMVIIAGIIGAIFVIMIILMFIYNLVVDFIDENRGRK